MKISVIIPVYNVEKYLTRCLESVVSQSFKDFEIILVDDGSTDSSGMICDKFSLNDSRIKVIHKINGGLSSARNAGLDIANGKYITFIDSDDWVLQDAFEYLISIIEKTQSDVVSADYIFTNGESIEANSDYKELVIEGTDNILKFYLEQDIPHKKNDFPVWIKLYRKELFNNIRFPNGKIYEDTITNYKIFSKCKKYTKSTRIIYAYYQRPQSITKSRLTMKNFDLIDVSKEMLELSVHNSELTDLCQRKIAMAYFSILSIYIRFGTDLSFTEIDKTVYEYKLLKHYYLRTEKRIVIHLISFLMCSNIKMTRKLYLCFRKNK